MPEQYTPKNAPRTREPTIMLEDLTSELLWPKLLRAPALALSPTRLIIGVIAAFLLTVLAWVPTNWIDPGSPTAMAGSRQPTPSLNPLGAFDQASGFLLDLLTIAWAHPWSTLLVGVPMLLVLSVFGCMIARSAAVEFAQGRIADQSDTSGYVLRRLSQLVTAVLGPLVLALILIGIIALGGFLISAPVVDLIGGFLYAIGLALGLLITLILAVHLLALPLIVPSIACEGTDGFDAIQRSYAYLVGRPLRVLSYAAILFTLGALSFGVYQLLMNGAIGITDWSLQLLGNDSGTLVLTGSVDDLRATQPTAHRIIEFWRGLFQLSFAGYVISFLYTSSAMLYLLIRRVCDGQDISEVWTDPQG